jgi:parallel beta-helix repeat protein
MVVVVREHKKLNLLSCPCTSYRYYVDRQSGDLYFLPPSGSHLPPDADIVVSVLNTVISTTGTKNTKFENLTVSFAQGTLMSVVGGGQHAIHNCTLSNAGGACLDLLGVNNSNVSNNVVYGCGTSGVSVSGGDLVTLEGSHISVVGNRISNYSRIIRTYQPAIGFNGVGIYVANNTLSHGPHTGITGGGCNNLFEFNSISHMAYECIDCGALYVGRSWAQRGNTARFNVFDTIRPTERLAQQTCSQSAIYLDDQMSGWDIYGNTIINSTWGVLIGGGRHNRIHGNTFINNDLDVYFDSRGLNWEYKMCQFNCSASEGSSCFRVALEDVHYTQAPYATQFPELVNIYAPESHPCTPIGIFNIRAMWMGVCIF